MKYFSKRYFHLLPTLLFVAVSLLSCSKEDEPVPDAAMPQIVFLFSPGGLGDMSYNDCILEGVQRFKSENLGIDIYIYSPDSLEEAERRIRHEIDNYRANQSASNAVPVRKP